MSEGNELKNQNETVDADTEAVMDVDLDESPQDSEAENKTDAVTDEKKVSGPLRAWNWFTKFYSANSFLIGVILAILIAYAYPPLGAVYLAPKITASWIAVVFIFCTFFLMV